MVLQQATRKIDIYINAASRITFIVTKVKNYWKIPFAIDTLNARESTSESWFKAFNNNNQMNKKQTRKTK